MYNFHITNQNVIIWNTNFKKSASDDKRKIITTSNENPFKLNLGSSIYNGLQTIENSWSTIQLLSYFFNNNSSVGAIHLPATR